MKRYCAITFDAGGTLVHPHPSVGETYSEILARHGAQVEAHRLQSGFKSAWKRFCVMPRERVDEETEKEWWRGMVRETFREISLPSGFKQDEYFEELWDEFAHPHRWRLAEGTLETLQELKEKGYPLAILSNWDSRLRTLLDEMKLTRYFDVVVISTEVGFEKPDPRIFHETRRQLKLPDGNLLHVGDSMHHDIQGARRAGWSCVRIQAENDEGERGVQMIRRLPELLTVVENQNP